jgi:predicted ATP-grasp superfamily ATP-dependent carboligase
MRYPAMSERVYIDLDEDLYGRLDGIDEERLIEALEDLADEVEAQQSGDELSAYSCTQDIEKDDELSEVEKTQLKLKARRRGYNRIAKK